MLDVFRCVKDYISRLHQWGGWQMWFVIVVFSFILASLPYVLK